MRSNIFFQDASSTVLEGDELHSMMASPISPILQCVLRCQKQVPLSIALRYYTVRPPKWMGYRHWKGYNQSYEETHAIYTEKSLSEMLTGTDQRSDTRSRAVNIGCDIKHERPSRRAIQERVKQNSSNHELEKAARFRQLEIPLDEVKEQWLTEAGMSHVKAATEHYGIYEDLFEGAYFYPVKKLTVGFEYDEEYITPVYRGNIIPASDARTAPIVEFDVEEGKLYTLVLSNPDSHLTDNEAEVLHWMIGNISGGDLSKGEVLCDYLPPFPPRGTGFHRHVFILYQHDKPVDFSAEKRPQNCTSLQERSFKTTDFYAKFEDDITPVGIAFFQAEWDHSVREIFHGVLNMKEPEFEYNFPHIYQPRQEMYPKNKVAFDRYFDRYRDKKDIAEEVIKMKMDMISPFKPNPKKADYPSIHKEPNKPSWLRTRDNLAARRLEQFKDLPQ